MVWGFRIFCWGSVRFIKSMIAVVLVQSLVCV